MAEIDVQSFEGMNRSDRSIVKSSLVISFFTFLTGILNYLTLAVLAFSFGTQRDMDAYFSASTIPQVIAAIVLAALSNAFIPVFVETKARDESGAWKMASIIMNVVFVIFLVIAVLGILFSREVISLMNPGLPKETLTLSASLFRILLLAMVVSGMSSILTSLHYAHHQFFRPSLAQGLHTLVTFLFVLLFRSAWGILSVGLGTLVGSLLQFWYLAPLFLKNHRYSFDFDARNKEIVKLARLILPLIVGSVFYKTNPLVERFLASRLEEGSISYLGYAGKIILALVPVITLGISSVLFPRMAEYSALKDYQGLRETLSKALRALIVITIPAAFIMAVAKFELVQLVFERGDFTAQATHAVGSALVAYLGFFLGASLTLPIVNTLYSLQENAKAALIGVLGFILYVFLAFEFSNYFGYLGIAAAASIQYIFCLILFIALLKKKLGRLGSGPILRCLFKTIFASGLASITLLASYRFAAQWIAFPFHFISLGILASAIYVLTLILLKTKELSFISFLVPFLRRGRP